MQPEYACTNLLIIKNPFSKKEETYQDLIRCELIPITHFCGMMDPPRPNLVLNGDLKVKRIEITGERCKVYQISSKETR